MCPVLFSIRVKSESLKRGYLSNQDTCKRGPTVHIELVVCLETAVTTEARRLLCVCVYSGHSQCEELLLGFIKSTMQAAMHCCLHDIWAHPDLFRQGSMISVLFSLPAPFTHQSWALISGLLVPLITVS